MEIARALAQVARLVIMEVPTAALSRGLAGVAGATLVVNLPGSRGGVTDAIDLLAGIVPHAVNQIRGVDH